MAILESGRNNAQPDELFEFTNGLDVDPRLAVQEVAVQKAWARELARLPDTGLKAEDIARIEATLDEAVTAIQNGTFEWRARDEDIHMHLECFVTDRLGDVGKRMHAGRSRNDLIATTLRLYVRDTVRNVAKLAQQVLTALQEQAAANIDVIVPGATHLQHGQPVRFAHVLLAHAEGFRRDLRRFAQVEAAAIENMPLGAAALAGTPLPVDLNAIAKELGFTAPTRNSYDAVGDRDFMLEGLAAYAICATHLARLSEDMIYWTATPVALVKLPPAWSTGSSIMPNKRNPDVPELTRGRAAHIIAASTDGLALVRTVPTSYGSDLHELKKVYMRSLDELTACLKVWPHFIAEMGVNKVRAQELLNTGHILATEIADDLTKHGLPFRDAYKIVAALVESAESQAKQIHQLPLDTVNALLADKSIAPLATFDYTFEAAVERRQNAGGTAKARVSQKIAEK